MASAAVCATWASSLSKPSAKAGNKQSLQAFAAFYDGHMEGLGLWKRAEHKRPNPVGVWVCFVAERSAAGSAS